MGGERGVFLPGGAGAALRRALTPPAYQLPIAVLPPPLSPHDPAAIAQFSASVPAGWRTVGTVRVDDTGALVISTLTLLPDGDRLDSGGVTGAVLRAVPTGAILSDVARWVAHEVDEQHARGLFATTWQPTDADRERAAAAKARGPRTGKRGPQYGPGHYRQVAVDAIAAQQRGERRVRAALAATWSERFGYPVQPETVRDWLGGARRRGFLAPTRAGQTVFRAGPALDNDNREPR